MLAESSCVTRSQRRPHKYLTHRIGLIYTTTGKNEKFLDEVQKKMRVCVQMNPINQTWLLDEELQIELIWPDSITRMKRRIYMKAIVMEKDRDGEVVLLIQ